MYCPKCGADGDGSPNYCRKCGVNLALVGKAVTVSEVIARGDSGLLPRIRTAMGNLKLDEVSEQVAQHVSMIGNEVERSVRESQFAQKFGKEKPNKKTPEYQRAHFLGQGFGSLFGGIGTMIVFYFISRKVAFNFPPDILAKIPFDVYGAISLAWLVGLIPALSGVGQIIGAFLTRMPKIESQAPVVPVSTGTTPLLDESEPEAMFTVPPPSVTEDTTAQLDYDRVPKRERQSSRG